MASTAFRTKIEQSLFEQRAIDVRLPERRWAKVGPRVFLLSATAALGDLDYFFQDVGEFAWLPDTSHGCRPEADALADVLKEVVEVAKPQLLKAKIHGPNFAHRRFRKSTSIRAAAQQALLNLVLNAVEAMPTGGNYA